MAIFYQNTSCQKGINNFKKIEIETYEFTMRVIAIIYIKKARL